MGLTTVVIADDHAVVRSGVQTLLEGEGGFDVVGEGFDLQSTVAVVREKRPDVLILDLHMPDGSSLAVLPALAEASPETRIVVLTMQNDIVFAREALQGGALAYVGKDGAGRDLVEAVRSAARGERYVSPQLGAELALDRSEGARADGDLSAREVEVLRLVGLGHTNAEIAEELHVSTRTVEAHRSHIQQKLRLSRRADLVRYALDKGILTP